MSDYGRPIGFRIFLDPAAAQSATELDPNLLRLIAGDIVPAVRAALRLM